MMKKGTWITILKVILLGAIMWCLTMHSTNTQTPQDSTAVPTSVDSTVRVKRDWVYHGFEIGYIVLNGADLASTYYFLKRGGYEANPIGRWMIENHLEIPFKIVTTGVSLWLMRQLRKNYPLFTKVTMIVLNGIFTGVVAHNFSITARLR